MRHLLGINQKIGIIRFLYSRSAFSFCKISTNLSQELTKILNSNSLSEFINNNKLIIEEQRFLFDFMEISIIIFQREVKNNQNILEIISKIKDKHLPNLTTPELLQLYALLQTVDPGQESLSTQIIQKFENDIKNEFSIQQITDLLNHCFNNLQRFQKKPMFLPFLPLIFKQIKKIEFQKNPINPHFFFLVNFFLNKLSEFFEPDPKLQETLQLTQILRHTHYKSLEDQINFFSHFKDLFPFDFNYEIPLSELNSFVSQIISQNPIINPKQLFSAVS